MNATIPIRKPENTVIVNGVPIRQTRKGRAINMFWYAADCVPFDVRWLGTDTDSWLPVAMGGDWKAAIRRRIGERNMTEWLRERKLQQPATEIAIL